jgi:hypothetical protein
MKGGMTLLSGLRSIMSSEREYRLEAARWLLAADQEQNPGRRIQLTKTAAAWLEVAVQTAINEQAMFAVTSSLRNLRPVEKTSPSARRASGWAPILRAEK